MTPTVTEVLLARADDDCCGLRSEDRAGSWELVIDTWSTLPAEHVGSVVNPVPATPEDLLVLVFTSGTSDEPKAVRCTHGKIAFPCRMLADWFGLWQRPGSHYSPVSDQAR